MPAIRLLVVADGYFLALTPPKYGISFAPSIDLTNNTFTISEFLYLIQNHPALDIVVTTAHRRADPNAKLQHFNFAQADLSQYDVIWMFGHEGWNGGYYGKPIGDDEVIAIARFMNAVCRVRSAAMSEIMMPITEPLMPSMA